MNIEVKTKPPELRVYANFLGLFLVVFAIVGIAIALFADEFPASTLVLLGLMPFALAAGLTYSARKFIIKVDSVTNMDALQSYIMEYLVSEDLMNVSEDAGGIWMHSTLSRNRKFNHWFGTEQVRIIRTPFYIQVMGHRRYIDGLETKLLFGRKS